MAGSLNKVQLIGNLGFDPEIRSTQDGREIANLRIATTDSWRDKNTGEKREKTEWHRVVIFSPGLVNVVKSYVKKGQSVYIEGALQTRKWTNKDGQEQYSTEIVLQGFGGTLTMLGGRNDSNASSGGSNSGGYAKADSAPNAGGSAEQFVDADLDDEIPF